MILPGSESFYDPEKLKLRNKLFEVAFDFAKERMVISILNYKIKRYLGPSACKRRLFFENLHVLYFVFANIVSGALDIEHVFLIRSPA